MKERPLLVFILAYFAGIIIFKYFSLLNFLLLLFILAYLVLFYDLRRLFLGIIISLLAGSMVAMFYTAQLQKKIVSIAQYKKIDSIAVIVASDVSWREGAASFLVKAPSGLFLAKIKEPFRRYEYGDKFSIYKPFIAELQGNSNFGLSNYDDYLKLHKIVGKIYFEESRVVGYLKPLFSWRRQIYRLKNILVSVHQRTLPAPYNNLLSSIIFGDTVAPLSAEMQEAYRRSGVVHLLVVSGSQIAILGGLFFSIAKMLRFSISGTVLFTSFFLFVFTIATGFGSSIARAWIMAELGLFAMLLGREKDFYTLLGVTAFISSLPNPLIIFDIGFQLSYLATIALVYLAPLLFDLFKKYLPEKLAKPISVSAAPLILTSPLTAFYFNSFSLIALPVNILIICWVELIVVLGFVTTVVGVVFLPAAQFLNMFNGFMLIILDLIINAFNKLPFATVNIPLPNVYIFILLMSVIICTVEYFRTKKKIFGFKAVALVLCFFVLSFAAERALTITMFDVGEGESILIRTPSNNTILVDCGNEKNDPVKNVVLPYLHKQGIDHIDDVLITHPHQDHLSGLRTLVKEIKIGHVIADLPADYLAVSVNYPYLNRVIDLDKVKIKTIYFVTVNAEEKLNNCSVVYLLEYQGFEMLLTGDMEKKVEKKLLAGDSLPDIDVLKVAHHGSDSSSSLEFVDTVKPEVSLISVGAGNRYKFPKKTVLDTLALYGKIYRTDLNGAIEITVDKNGKYKLSSNKKTSG